jgi:DNA sulfur modification protein DndE
LEQRTQEAVPTIAATPAFGGLLRLEIGWENDAPVSIEFNRRTNSYLAVTGKPGSGKTQFVKDLLAQIRRQSDYAVNFIFFDYAKGDVADDADFIEATRTEVVRLPESSLPLNPFARVNVNSEMAVKVAAQEFADLMESVEKRLGIVQKRRLNDAIVHRFETTRGTSSPLPDFGVFDINKGKPKNF